MVDEVDGKKKRTRSKIALTPHAGREPMSWARATPAATRRAKVFILCLDVWVDWWIGRRSGRYAVGRSTDRADRILAG